MLAMEQLLGGLPGDEVQQAEAKAIATMPLRLEGLGLRSADRMAHAAYWAADALHMIAGRLPGGQQGGGRTHRRRGSGGVPRGVQQNIPVSATDERAIEVLAMGLPSTKAHSWPLTSL